MWNLSATRLAKGLIFCSGLTFIGCEGRVSKSAPPNARPLTPSTETNSTEDSMILTVQSEPFGQTEDGQDITSFSLRNRTGMKVGLINRGGIITSVEVPDRQGQLANVTVSLPNPADYLVNKPYLGGICGRYANRIAKGKFSLDGQEYTLVTNGGENHIHGGKEHFMRKLWKADPFQTETEAGVKLSYTSLDMEEGYPGTLKTVVTYSLNDENELKIEYEATTDKPTILNLTNHAYWNLAGLPDGTILDHQLTLFCNRYLPVDEGSIPLGEILPVAGTCMDFTKGELIGARIEQAINGAGGYDHCYVVNGAPGIVRLAAKVVEPKSGRVMEVATTEPGVQFYTGNHLAGDADSGGVPKHGAFCLETQHFPDSPNHPEFPTTRLNPGETYRQTTVHKFSVLK